MEKIEETTVEARQGETSRKHRVLKVLIVSTLITGAVLLVASLILV